MASKTSPPLQPSKPSLLLPTIILILAVLIKSIPVLISPDDMPRLFHHLQRMADPIKEFDFNEAWSWAGLPVMTQVEVIQ